MCSMNPRASHARCEVAEEELGSLADEAMDKRDGQDAWRYIVEKVSAAKEKAPWVLERLDCAVLAYVWPVLDENVTRDLAHLTKVPYACHATASATLEERQLEQQLFPDVPM